MGPTSIWGSPLDIAIAIAIVSIELSLLSENFHCHRQPYCHFRRLRLYRMTIRFVVSHILPRGSYFREGLKKKREKYGFCHTRGRGGQRG